MYPVSPHVPRGDIRLRSVTPPGSMLLHEGCRNLTPEGSWIVGGCQLADAGYNGNQAKTTPEGPHVPLDELIQRCPNPVQHRRDVFL